MVEEHFISSIIVDPANPDVVVAGAFGSAVPSEPRGAFQNHGWRKNPGRKRSQMLTALAEWPIFRLLQKIQRILYAAALNPPPGEPGERDLAGESRIYIQADEGRVGSSLERRDCLQRLVDELGWL